MCVDVMNRINALEDRVDRIFKVERNVTLTYESHVTLTYYAIADKFD